MHLLNTEAMLSVACLDSFDPFNYRFDALVLGNYNHDELNVMDD